MLTAERERGEISHRGGFAGYSSVNSSVRGKTALAQRVLSLPGMPQFHLRRFTVPSAEDSGLAKNLCLDPMRLFTTRAQTATQSGKEKQGEREGEGSKTTVLPPFSLSDANDRALLFFDDTHKGLVLSPVLSLGGETLCGNRHAGRRCLCLLLMMLCCVVLCCVVMWRR